MILVEKLKKLAENAAIKNIGIQRKESIKDHKLILIFIYSLLNILSNFNKFFNAYLLNFFNGIK
ncbi:hypothetical protein GGGNBK_15790 [Sporosarcina sp. ANT_H38]